MSLRTLLAFFAAFVVGLTLQACGTTPQRCSAATCPTGCCDSSGLCASGNTQSACGSRGAACVGCSFGFQCLSGACVATGTGTGGGFSGVGGGSTAGGSAGGSTAGGAAVGGGSTAGGIAGGLAGGSTAGGSAVGGGSTAGGSAVGGGTTAGGSAVGGGSTAGGSAVGGGSTAGGSAVGGGDTAGGSAVGGGSTAGGSAVGGGSTAGGSAVGGGSSAGGSAGGGSAGCSASCSGCCLNGVCQAGNTTGACGARGVACFACSTNQFCSAGACTGANTGDTGATCTVSADCKEAILGGATRECVGPYRADGGSSGWPGGYCSNSGCDSFVDCPGASSSCGTDAFCYRTCFPANAGQGNCRAGYVCSDALTVDGGTFALCVPDCRNPGSRWCGPTGTCGALGYCQ